LADIEDMVERDRYLLHVLKLGGQAELFTEFKCN
jgi:hypothetical protein